MELFKGQSLLEFTERFKTEVSEFNIDRYLAEYSFRINRSQNKDTIFFKFRKFCNLLIFKNLPLPPPKGE